MQTPAAGNIISPPPHPVAGRGSPHAVALPRMPLKGYFLKEKNEVFYLHEGSPIKGCTGLACFAQRKGILNKSPGADIRAGQVLSSIPRREGKLYERCAFGMRWNQARPKVKQCGVRQPLTPRRSRAHDDYGRIHAGTALSALMRGARNRRKWAHGTSAFSR